VADRKRHLLAPAGVLANLKSSPQRSYACGSNFAATLAGTSIYRFRSATEHFFQGQTTRSEGEAMSGFQIFAVLLVMYLAGLVGIGLYFNKRQQSVTDFWLAGRKIGPVNTAFSAAASWLTAGAILAVIGFFMLSGMGSIWGFVAPNILALLVIALFAKRLKRLPAITQPELLEQRYSSALRAPVAVIITIVMILFAVADIKGFAFVLQVYYGLDPVWAALIVALAVSTYVTLGGFSAVVWTDVLQYLLLAVFACVMAFAAAQAALQMSAAAEVHAMADLLGTTPAGWWNPLSVGLPAALIFSLAIIPGWVTEQDPWQRVWAARHAAAARIGMAAGAALIAVVFAACAVIALALNRIYPEIAAMGFPAGMAKAEPALLAFITSGRFSPLVVALTAIGLAAAAMSCADTFAASGASCLSRDIYQRFMRPNATMGEMLKANRMSVLFIILCATGASFFITSIIDAIHIATFIASAACFFPLLGGIFWKRATAQGAMAGLVIGAGVQVALVVTDLARTGPLAPPFLEGVSPLLMGHGVLAGLGLSGAAFIGVSLLTPAPEPIRLAPFFEEEARKLAAAHAVAMTDTAPDREAFSDAIVYRPNGERTLIQARLDAGRPIQWPTLVARLKASRAGWVTPGGSDAVYRLTDPDLLGCVMITRGRTERDLWLQAEPRNPLAAARRAELAAACRELTALVA
jgi:SSS family solute:Na+ symporter